MPTSGMGPVVPAGPDGFAPPATQFLYQPQPSTSAPVFPSYTGTAPPGTQLAYSSAQYQSTVAQDLGSTLQINAITGLPQRYPYKLLLEWGTANQEVVIITSAPSGNGPYTFGGVLRGQDGGGPQVTHSPGAQVNHGVSAADFYQIAPVFNVCDTQFGGGADPTGTLDITAAFQAALNACIAAGGGVVQFPAGNFRQNATVTANVSGTAVYIQGAGRWATTINYYGSGDCLRFYDSSNYNTRLARSGGVRGLTIYGGNSSTVAASAGLHIGDILQLELDVAVTNFNQAAGSIGVWLDSQYYQTEQLQGRIYAGNCLSHVVFDNSANASGSSNGSFERCDLSVYINQVNATYDGVVLQGGTFITDGRLAIYGNFVTQTPAVSSAVLRVTGSTPVSGATNSNIANSRLDIGCELDVTVGSSAPRTIFFGAGSNNIYACYGILSFNQAGAFQASNNSNQLIFYQGTIHGDTSLVSTWLLSSDGTTTSGGAIQLNPVSETQGYISIYSTTLGIPVYMVPDVNNTGKAPALGAISAQGFGIVGSTSNAGNTCFAVLNFAQTTGPGLGHATFTCLDNNTVVTFNNTLDNGSGAATFTGVVHESAGTDTSGTATASSPSFTSNTPAQVNTTQDCILYIAVQTSAALSVAIGPTSTPANTICPSKSYALSLLTIRVPKSWYVNITGTIANLTITAVTC